MDLVEHYLGKQPLFEIPSRRKILLMEGKEGASKVENAICMAYNIEHHKWTNKTGPSKAGAWRWLGSTKTNQKPIAAGRSIVASSKFPKNLTGPLKQAGAGGGGTTNYADGTNTTSKTDIHGTTAYISLKQSSAQLASAKGGETKGIMDAALKHTQHVDGSITKDIEAVIDKTVKRMESNQDNRAFTQVTASKRAVEEWYTSKKNEYRWKQVELEATKLFKGSRLKLSDNKITAHLKKELSRVGAAGKKPKKGKESVGLIQRDGKFISVATKKMVDEILETWTLETTRIKSAKKGKGVLVSQTHIERRRRMDGDGVVDSMLDQDALSDKIRWQISSSMDHTVWEGELNAELKKNAFLRTAIIYEAASGEYKFTGKEKKNKASHSGNTSIANKMMVFSGEGKSATCTDYQDMWGWCVAHKDLAQQINISFKGSGTDIYAKLGISTVLKPQNESLTDSLMGRLKLNDIIEEEYAKLKNKVLLLTEGGGILDSIIGLGKKVAGWVSNFFKEVWNRVSGALKGFAKWGLEKFAELLGWELTADCKVGLVP